MGLFRIDIADATDNLLGDGPIITGTKWAYTQKLSEAGEWSAELPTAEPRLTTATLRRRVYAYTQTAAGEVWLGSGIIMKRGYGLNGQAPSLTALSGPDLLRELTGITVDFEVSSTTAAPRADAILNLIFAAVPTWTVTIPAGLPDITARFVNQSVLNALIATCERCGAFFWVNPGTRHVIIARTPPDSGLVATNLADGVAIERNLSACLVTEITREESIWEGKNRYKVYGAGDGAARLTLAMATVWPGGAAVTSPFVYTDPFGVVHTFVLDKTTNTITDTSSVTAYGQDEEEASFKEVAAITSNDADMIAAANTLVSAAVWQLVLASVPQVSYQLSVAAVRTVIHPGQRIHVAARKIKDGVAYIDVNEDLIILAVTYDNDQITGLTVSTSWRKEKTGATVVAEAVQKLTALDAHPQAGPDVNTMCYREDVDDNYGADFPFWMNNGTQIIFSVILRYKLEKLRSSVTAIGSTITATVDLPDHPHTMTDHHHDMPHQHDMLIDPGSGGGTVQVFSGGGSPDYGSLVGNGIAHQIRISTDYDTTPTSDSNSVITVGGGLTVDVPVDLSGGVGIGYGVYVDPDPAYTVTDLDWTVNTIPVTETPTSIAGGFYEVDITHYMIDPLTLRPLAYANVVEAAVKVASHAAKKVRITAQIELRTSVQATVVA